MADSSALLQHTGLATGDLIDEKYRVDAVLGRGGMGVVIAATHLDLQEKVAIKFLLAKELPADAIARFLREARATVRIKGEHVVRVSDVGTMPSGAPYMVMEHLDGEDLSQALLREGPPPIDVSVGYVLEAIEAVAQAHALGIIHRDLKLGNLFLANRPDGSCCVKVLDFGISRAPASGEPSLTLTEDVVGSPHYMAPEMWITAKNASEQSDIWSLGVILYLLLSGERPFTGETSLAEQCQAILNDEPVPLPDLRSHIDEGLWQVVRRCLQKKSADRYTNVAELAEALLPFAPPRAAIHAERARALLSGAKAGERRSQDDVKLPARDVATAPTKRADDTTSATTVPRPQGATGSNRSLVAVVIAVVVAAALFVGWRLRSDGEAGDQAKQASSAARSSTPVTTTAPATSETNASSTNTATASAGAVTSASATISASATTSAPPAAKSASKKRGPDDLAGVGELDR